MICLGIESTAHTIGIGIVSDENKKCNILANEKKVFVPKTGGLIPRELAEHHFNQASIIVQEALKKSGLSLKDIDIVSFSQGPGIGNSLRIGAITGRSLALNAGVPLVPVNHCIAHIEIGKALTGSKDPIVLYASGANTQVIGFLKGRYRILGETLDIGIGNMLDSFGRAINIPFPAGPTIDKWFFESNNFIELPYTVKGMDFAFSGLQTAAELKLKKFNKKDVSMSLMHNAFAMLTEVTERALAHTEKKEVLLTGGVASSNALREMMGKMCKERGAKLFVPDRSVCVDNAAMIAWLGIVMHKAGWKTRIENSEIKPKQRTDDIEINWV